MKLNFSIFLKKYKPSSPGRRHKQKLSSFFYDNKLKNLFKQSFKKNGGRNIKGFITVRHKGGSAIKPKFVIINWNFSTFSNISCVYRLLHSSQKKSLIGLLKFSNGSYTCILLPSHVWVGSLVIVSNSKHNFIINSNKICFITCIQFLKPFEIFFNLTDTFYKNKYARAAGVYCKLITINFNKNLVLIELPTFVRKLIKFNTLVTKGRSSNIFHKNEIFGKAGYSRLLNIRPTVRGVAMNPVDHPHGGRTKTNSPEVTPWNKIAKYNR